MSFPLKACGNDSLIFYVYLLIAFTISPVTTQILFLYYIYNGVFGGNPVFDIDVFISVSAWIFFMW